MQYLNKLQQDQIGGHNNDYPGIISSNTILVHHLIFILIFILTTVHLYCIQHSVNRSFKTILLNKSYGLKSDNYNFCLYGLSPSASPPAHTHTEKNVVFYYVS